MESKKSQEQLLIQMIILYEMGLLLAKKFLISVRMIMKTI